MCNLVSVMFLSWNRSTVLFCMPRNLYFFVFVWMMTTGHDEDLIMAWVHNKIYELPWPDFWFLVESATEPRGKHFPPVWKRCWNRDLPHLNKCYWAHVVLEHWQIEWGCKQRLDFLGKQCAHGWGYAIWFARVCLRPNLRKSDTCQHVHLGSWTEFMLYLICIKQDMRRCVILTAGLNLRHR